MNDLKLLPTEKPLIQEEFLTTNWQALQAKQNYGNYHSCKYIKIVGQVATVMGREAIIRSAPIDLPNGYYSVDRGGNFVKVNPSSAFGSFRESRDIDVLLPDFENLPGSAPIYFDEIAHLCEFIEHARKSSHVSEPTIAITEGALVSGSNHSLFTPVSCKLPVNGGGLVFDAHTLKIVFTEMRRYEYICIWNECRPEHNPSPFILGLDWARCALIKPRHRDW